MQREHIRHTDPKRLVSFLSYFPIMLFIYYTELVVRHAILLYKMCYNRTSIYVLREYRNSCSISVVIYRKNILFLSCFSLTDDFI